jgi:ribosomal protein S18 acetylase RimI-like enzyme
MLSRFFQDPQAPVKQPGFIGAVRWAVKIASQLPYRQIEYTVFARSLQDEIPTAKPRTPVTMRIATQADLTLFQEIAPSAEIKRFARRLEHGRLCFLALDGEELAAYCWATTRIDPKLEKLRIKLMSGDAYLDDAYTVSKYRRQGIQKALKLWKLQHMKSLGCQRAILIVDVNNHANQILSRKIGFYEADHLTFRRILWYRSYYYHAGKF